MAKIALHGETASAQNGKWKTRTAWMRDLLESIVPDGGPSPAWGDYDNQLVDIAHEQLGAKVLEYDPCGLPEEDPDEPA